MTCRRFLAATSVAPLLQSLKLSSALSIFIYHPFVFNETPLVIFLYQNFLFFQTAPSLLSPHFYASKNSCIQCLIIAPLRFESYAFPALASGFRRFAPSAYPFSAFLSVLPVQL